MMMMTLMMLLMTMTMMMMMMRRRRRRVWQVQPDEFVNSSFMKVSQGESGGASC